MITHNRLEYTKKALEYLYECAGAETYVLDNGSTDGTVEYLRRSNDVSQNRVFCFPANWGIAHAMNMFLTFTNNYVIVGKVDNDTIVPPNFIEKMMPHMEKADIVQAKHKLIEASKVGTFDEWTSKMPGEGALKYNHFVGGSGILFKRQLVNHIPETESKIMGWRQFQRDHPELKKAFATDVEIELLDQDGYPKEYESYYQSTGRV